MNEDEEKTVYSSWYQLVAVLTLIAYIITILVIIGENNIELGFVTYAIYAFIGIFVFVVMHGIGKIVSLLTEIKDKLTLNSSINNTKNKTTTKKDDNKGNEEVKVKEDEIPWELKE